MLRDLLRLETVNPPGGERIAAEYVVEALESVGLKPEILEGSPDRSNVVCRIRADKDTGQGPLLLTGHLDVVPVEEEHWTMPAFGGEIKNGYLYGRGAIDMKNHVAACMLMMQLLAKHKIPLRRDVIFAAVADEEEGAHWGSRYLVEEHPEKVRADWMIGEIGGYTLYINGVRYYPVQIAEKGRALIKMTAKGRPGHGSMPHSEMSTTRLAQALAKLGSSRLPQHQTAAMTRFLTLLGQSQKPPAKWALPALLKPRLSPVLLDRLLPGELAVSLGSLLSNTASATLLEGSYKSNVIPSQVSATLDGRLLPGQSPEDLIRELKALLGDDLLFEVESSFPAIEQKDPDSELYRLMCQTLAVHDPKGVALPYMIPGFTDAQYFSRLGTRCYGFSPHRFPEEDNIRFSELFHGHDERIHVDGYQWGLRVLWDVVRRFVAA